MLCLEGLLLDMTPRYLLVYTGNATAVNVFFDDFISGIAEKVLDGESVSGSALDYVEEIRKLSCNLDFNKLRSK